MRNFAEKKALLEAIQPHYIILKPALCGGFKDADEYQSCRSEPLVGNLCVEVKCGTLCYSFVAHKASPNRYALKDLGPVCYIRIILPRHC